MSKWSVGSVTFPRAVGSCSMKDLNQMKHLCKIQRIGRRSQNQYWCGFCRQIVVMIALGVEGASERFKHINHHIIEEKRSMSEWERLEGSLDYE
jgi:hypothetical protein